MAMTTTSASTRPCEFEPRSLLVMEHTQCNRVHWCNEGKTTVSHNIHAQYANSPGGIEGWDSPKERRQLGDRHPRFEFTIMTLCRYFTA